MRSERRSSTTPHATRPLGRLQRKVTFVKRVVVYGLPILLGAGYYLDE